MYIVMFAEMNNKIQHIALFTVLDKELEHLQHFHGAGKFHLECSY